MKLLQLITLLCGLAGSVLGIGLLHVQTGRDGEDTSNTLQVKAPCVDGNGEPTC